MFSTYRFINSNYDYSVLMKTDLPSREAKLAGEAEQKKKNTSIIKSSSFPFWSWQKLIKTDEIQSVSTEESAKHENKVEQQAQFS